uniref:Leucine rich repeat containing 45 n=1 Tax=Coturnix japonica TaxID=93934 RepID=A0A8C2UDA6_COTJA
MDELRRAYARLCAAPQDAVLRRMRDSGGEPGRARLDLAEQSLSLETCGALGRLLPGNAHLAEVALGDCGLSEDGVKLLLHGLCSNTTVTSLDLKVSLLRVKQRQWDGEGNRNMSSAGVRNSPTTQLCARPALLCLRTHGIADMWLLGCKIAFCIDLRWNNIGLLGGRALLNCLQSNKTLKKLELAGNNVPSDILKAVEQAMDHNRDRQTILSESQNRTSVLSKEILNLKDEKAKQFLDLMDTIDKQREEIARSGRISAGRVSQLQEALNEQHSIMNSLKAKLQMTEAALALSEQKVHNLGELLSAMKQEQANMAERHFEELQQQKQEGADREGKLFRDLSASNEKNLFLRNQVDELEKKCKVQQDQLFQLKQDLTNTTAELKLRAVQAEERLEMEKRRFKQSLEDVESLRLKEVDHLTQHMEASERSMQDRVQRLESIRIALEEELSQVKAAALTERGHAEEELIKVRTQARLDEQQRLEHLEEKLRLMTEARDEAQNCCLKQKQMVSEAQVKANQLNLHADGLKRRIEELQQELNSKEQEKVTEVNKVKVELQEQIGHLQAERTAQEGLREKIAALERQLKVLSSNHREALLDKEGEISMLMEKLRMKEADISRMREEEAQRASILQNAIMAYVQGSSLGTHSLRK